MTYCYCLLSSLTNLILSYIIKELIVKILFFERVSQFQVNRNENRGKVYSIHSNLVVVILAPAGVVLWSALSDVVRVI